MKITRAVSPRRVVRLAAIASSCLALLACGGGGDDPAQASLEQPQSTTEGLARMANLNATTATVAGAMPVKAVSRGDGWVSASVTPEDLGQGTTRAATSSSSFTGTAWYVDAETGSDKNPGTLERPWKTLQAVKQVSMGEGDALLLKCGSVWRDSLELTSANARNGGILIGAYGDCSGSRRPVIRASDWVSPEGWAQVAGETRPVYSKSWTKPVERLFNDGKPVLQARFPNESQGLEFARTVSAISNNSFKMAPEELAAVAGKDLVGATVYVKVAAWQVDTAIVRAFNPSSGLITLDRSLGFIIKTGAGYFLEGKPWMIDRPGEWAFDNQAQELVWWAEAGRNPGTIKGLEASWRQNGLVVRWMPNVRVERLRVEQQINDGFVFVETPNVLVRDVESSHVKELGVSVLVSPGAVVQNSLVHGAGRAGIILREAEGGQVFANRVTDTGGFGRGGDTDAGINVIGKGISARDNVVERSAGVGMRFANRPSTVLSGNTIHDSCLRLTDCAGIYTFTANAPAKPPAAYVAGGLVTNNFIVGARSHDDGCSPSCVNLATGIYLDELSSGVTLEGNAISDVEVGIGIHNAPYNIITNNLVQGASFAAFRGSQTRVDQPYLKGTQLTGNYFFTHRAMSMSEGVPSLSSYSFGQYWFHAADAKTIFQAGTNMHIAGNKLISTQPQGDVPWAMAALRTHQVLSKADWKAYAPTDEQISLIKYKYYNANIAGDSLLSNGKFDPAMIGSWGVYLSSDGSGGKFQMGEFAGCGKQCAKFTAGSTADYLYSHPFSMISEPGRNLYRLRFTAIAGPTGGMKKAVVRRNSSPWESYGLNMPNEDLAPGQVAEVEQFFLARNSDAGILDLRSSVGGETMFRDVSLVRVASVEFPDRHKLSVQVMNPLPTARTFPCSATGLSTCEVVDESGARVIWPLHVPARASKVLFARDVKWTQ